MPKNIPARCGTLAEITLIVLGLTLAASQALAQRVGENVVTQAEDAYGFRSGSEAIGLYDSTSVRGFSPAAAGNIRVEGLFADSQSELTVRTLDHSVVRVGANTFGTLLSAPSGIVDYSLRRAGPEDALSTRLQIDSFGALIGELDGGLRLTGGMSVAGGVATNDTGNDYRGTEPRAWSWGLVPHWHWSDRLDILSFYERMGLRRQIEPFYYTAGPYSPPRIRRGVFLGEPWSHFSHEAENAGLIVDVQVTGNLSLRLGGFGSTDAIATDTFDLIQEIGTDGFGNRTVLRLPPERYESRSGDTRLAYTWRSGRARQQVTVGARGRRIRSRYGGAFEIDVGRTSIDSAPSPSAAPPLEFDQPQTLDRTDETTVLTAYKLQWDSRLDFAIGVGDTAYRKTVGLPAEQAHSTRSSTVVYSSFAGWRLGGAVYLFASLSRGLEASGVAPSAAVNRGEVLPAILTHQRELGLRVSRPPIEFTTSLFEICKPYASLQPGGVFALDGTVCHRGAEASLSGRLTPRLNVVFGAVGLDAELRSAAVNAGLFGRRPIGIPDYQAQVSADYTAGSVRGLSFDAILTLGGSRSGKLSGRLQLPARQTLDVGMRYRFTGKRVPVELRAQVLNLFDTYALNVSSDEAFSYLPGRSMRLAVTADL